MKSCFTAAAVAVASLVLAACGSTPPTPEWKSGAHDDLQRFMASYFKGEARADSEFDRARAQLASTGQVALVARAELTKCAAATASLVFDPCDGFEKLRRDAPPAERAYADYLAGRATPAEVPLLPEQHRAIASGREDAASVQAIADPTARLVAAGVMFRMGRVSPQVVQLAADTASHEGWRRPLLAWLGVQAQRAERAGAKDEAERIRRRMALVSDGR
jgi:hypothetical protein